MALTKPAKAVLCVFAVPVTVWIAASLYFTIAGCDSSGDCICEYLPAPQNLAPEENAYTAIKEFAENIPSNGTPLFSDHKLRMAYFDGTTNRLDLAEEARAYLAAESNTIAAAERILAAKGIEVPMAEVLSANAHVCTLMRIANIYKVKATYEAAQGDLALGRQSLLDVYKIGRFLQTSDSLLLGMADIIGTAICGSALDTAAKPLFAPDDDEAWRAKLRGLHLEEISDDRERTKRAAERGVVFARATLNSYATNRTMFVQMAFTGPINFFRASSLTSEEVSAEMCGDLETRFLALLAACCPGYVRYSLHPNRVLNCYREKVEEFCRKIDEGAYDAEYAKGSGSHARKSHLSRNWLAHEVMQDFVFNGTYKMFYRTRFHALAEAAVLACRSYKAKHGEYPEVLSDLVPEFLAELPRDPYDGEELRYNATDHFIWTRGEKLDFDGEVSILLDGKPKFKTLYDSRCVKFLDDLRRRR